MDSPLLQYARETNARESQMRAMMGAEAIGYNLAQQKLQMDKEANDKAQKLSLLANMYGAAKDPMIRVDLLKQLGGEAGFDTSALTDYESAFAKDLENLILVVEKSKKMKNKQEADAMVTEAYKSLQLKYPGKAPAEPEKRYKIDMGLEEPIDVGEENATQWAMNKYRSDQAYQAALAKAKTQGQKTKLKAADDQYKAAKDEWARIFEAYAPGLGENMQILGDFDTLMDRAQKDPSVVNMIIEKMKKENPQDVVRYNAIRKIFDNRLGLLKEVEDDGALDDIFGSVIGGGKK